MKPSKPSNSLKARKIDKSTLPHCVRVGAVVAPKDKPMQPFAITAIGKVFVQGLYPSGHIACFAPSQLAECLSFDRGMWGDLATIFENLVREP